MRMYSTKDAAKILGISRSCFNSIVDKHNIIHCAEEYRKIKKYNVKIRVFSACKIELVKKIMEDRKLKKEVKPIKLPDFIAGTIPKSSSKPKVHMLDSYKNGAFSERMIKRNNAVFK